MGKYMHGTINLYSDSAFTTLVASFPNIIFPIAVGNTDSVSITDIHTNYNFFTNRLYSDEFLFLGWPLIVGLNRTIRTDLIPSQWLPACIQYNASIDIDSTYTSLYTDKFWRYLLSL